MKPYFIVEYKAKQYISSKLVGTRHFFITDDKNYLAPGKAQYGKKAQTLNATPFNVGFKKV
jgi:hypothetical protein